MVTEKKHTIKVNFKKSTGVETKGWENKSVLEILAQ